MALRVPKSRTARLMSAKRKPRKSWLNGWVPIRTIYAGAPSHIRPLAHLREFVRIVRQARRDVRRLLG